MSSSKIYALVDYEDPYVQPLLYAALQSRLPADLFCLITDSTQLPPSCTKLLQWKQYETIDFDTLLSNSSTHLANSYVIRKALIRKHYLAATYAHWLAKCPDSLLQRHMMPTVDFEVDYAEFLDDALVEAFELKESWARNEGVEPEAREWWILKPGMSDRGQGIRLFSSEEELTEIFEAWDPPSDDEDEDDEALSSDGRAATVPNADDNNDGVITSQLRHFVAQPYIHPPLLFTAPHASAGRKFHIRTYVVAVGALQVYVYKPMLALFAAQSYRAPTPAANEDLSSHLSNTCLQTGEREGSVCPFWSLPTEFPGLEVGKERVDWQNNVFDQICKVSGEIFEAAARSMSIHFQPLPNAFEIYGLDFLVDAQGETWMLEVNAFPDFAQTGPELQDLVKGLFEEVVDVAVKPFFGVGAGDSSRAEGNMVRVLDIDLGKR